MINAIDYSSFGKIRVSGNDAEQVLQNIFTQDMELIVPGTHRPAALLTHTGKMLLYMDIYRLEESYILVLDNTPAAKGIPLIDKYIITEDVKLDDVTEDYAYFQIFRAEQRSPAESRPIQPGEYLLCSQNQKADFIKQNGLNIMSGPDAEKARLEAGVPRYGIDMDENTILSETGFEDVAASETKGCYPGQEVIARIKTYSGLKRKLMSLYADGKFNIIFR